MVVDAPFWPLASSSWDDREIQTLYEVINSGQYTMGARVKKFESEFAKWCGRKYAVMVNSGSSANLIAATYFRYLHDFDTFQNSDQKLEVIVPAVSWGTTYFPLAQCGYRLVFVDVRQDTFNIDESLVQNAITDQTVGICVPNLLGNVSRWDKLQELAKRNNLWMIEDNCESMGASSDFGDSGLFGDLSTFSFFYSHHICTMEGGMVVTDDLDAYEALMSLRAHGWGRDVPYERNFLGNARDTKWKENFRFYLPGYNVRPLEMSGALGSIQLKKMDEILEKRRANALVLQAKLSQVETNWILQSGDNLSSWFTFGFINRDVKNGNSIRDKLVKLLEAESIQSRPIVTGDFTKNPVLSYMDYRISSNLTVASLIENCGLMIGNHHFDLAEKVDVLIAALLKSEKI
jgi:CDP-6-deoxy-D-xylo-4-hexulose-3-dehydrase